MSMDIENERREYSQAGEQGVHAADLKQDPLLQFEQWLLDAKNANISDPTAMMLATVDAQGMPRQRTVLLKGFSETGFRFFTNLESAKAQHIAANDQVCLIFPWLSMERQVIIQGRAQKLSNKENLAYFLTRPRDSQLAAWVSEQSSPIDSRELLLGKFKEMTERFANKDISLPAFWGGYNIVPSRIEFWSGGEKRLHDRFEYVKEGEQWVRNRLQP